MFLWQVYTKNPDKSKTLYAMLEDDIANNNTKHKDSATVALVWLTRYVMVNFVGFSINAVM